MILTPKVVAPIFSEETLIIKCFAQYFTSAICANIKTQYPEDCSPKLPLTQKQSLKNYLKSI